MKMKKFICVLLVAIISVNVYAAVKIAANDPNIQYTGRIDFSDPLSPLLSWSGSSVIANFQGASISATLKTMVDAKGINYFYAIIDNGTPTLITCQPGQKTYEIAAGLSDAIHKIELYKRTEGNNGSVAFKGFILDSGKSLANPPAKAPHKIEFYGDSITVGLALESTADVQTNNYTNNYLAYGSITARNLNAQCHSIAVSGIGVVKSWWDETMPANYYYRCVATNGSSVWDFNQWMPDIIVINLGQNDSWLGTTQSQAVTGYVNFVNMLRAKYNDTKTKKIPIILAIGSMDATKDGSPWPGYIAQVAKSLRKDYSDKNIYRVVFPYCGLNSHPHAKQHSDMAKQLTKFITKNIPAFRQQNN